MKKDSGFTLIELVVTVSLLGILLTMAVPNFTTLVKNSRLSTQANDFIIAANLARSEAIKRNLNVVICRSADGASCANSGGWEQGWVVFVDNDSDGGLDAGETVLRVFPELTGDNTLRANANFTNRVTYRPRGFTSAPGTLVLCDDRNGDGDTTDAVDYASGRAIIINVTGRPQLEDAPNSTFTNCTTP